jgi:hypothetical protein
MPRALRVKRASESKLRNAYKRRAQRFRADLDRLPRKVTREDLAAVLADVYRRGYMSGRSQGVRERLRKVAA